jgi:hypothetical protein
MNPVSEAGKSIAQQTCCLEACRSPADPEGKLSDGHIGERIVQVSESRRTRVHQGAKI